MNQSDTQQALDRLRSFSLAMKNWETAASTESRALDWETGTEEDMARMEANRRSGLVEIFSEFCAEGTSAVRLQDQRISIQLDSPEYDPDRDVVTSVETRQASLLVQVRGQVWIHRYELVERDGKWWIRDKCHYKSEKEGSKWTARSL